MPLFLSCCAPDRNEPEVLFKMRCFKFTLASKVLQAVSNHELGAELFTGASFSYAIVSIGVSLLVLVAGSTEHRYHT